MSYSKELKSTFFMSKICIIHYHLNPGGVTRIIESQIRSLKELNKALEILVITGNCEKPESITILGADIVINEAFNYLPEKTDNLPQRLLRIQNLLLQYISEGDIIHFHNMNLGKNPLLTAAVSKLAQEGFFVLNHAHDFAEDRPENFEFLNHVLQSELGMNIREIMYPDVSNYLYATLNSADRQRLINYRVSDTRAFLLPNPVDIITGLKNKNSIELKRTVCSQLHLDANKLLITYPVRVIRRKNIGEYILLSVLFSNDANWVVTQPPMNPVEIAPYEAWKNFCKEKNIDLVFEAGVHLNFEDLIRASDWCLTTSIKEGFGMVYMEPWLLETPVGGRNLEYITSDLLNSGMIFPLLYDKIQVENDGKLVDFAGLEMDVQMKVISEILNKRNVRQKTIKCNPMLKIIFDPVERNIIESNRSTIVNKYSLQKYAKRLEAIYKEFTG